MPGTKKPDKSKLTFEDRNAIGNLMIELLDEFEDLTTYQIRVAKRLEKKLNTVKALLDQIEGRA